MIKKKRKIVSKSQLFLNQVLFIKKAFRRNALHHQTVSKSRSPTKISRTFSCEIKNNNRMLIKSTGILYPTRPVGSVICRNIRIQYFASPNRSLVTAIHRWCTRRCGVTTNTNGICNIRWILPKIMSGWGATRSI